MNLEEGEVVILRHEFVELAPLVEMIPDECEEETCSCSECEMF